MAKVIHTPFSPFVNDNEKITLNYIKSKLEKSEDNNTWYVYTNIYLSADITSNIPLEVDMLIVSNKGIHVIEVKNWDRNTLDDMESSVVTNQGIKICRKAKIIGSTFKNKTGSGPFVKGKFLFSKDSEEIYENDSKRQNIEGAEIYGLKEWRKLLCINCPDILNYNQINAFNKIFAKDYYITKSSHIRKFHEFEIIKPLKSINEPFHRVFQAKKNPGKDKVILHVYDLSAYRASEDPRKIAEREANVLIRLQKISCLPSIIDSYQEAPEYPGEMYFYSYNDYESKTLEERAKDRSWEANDRILACINCYKCLKELHEFDNGKYLHRYLNPGTIKIKSNGLPIFTQLQYMKLSDTDTIANIAIENIHKSADYGPPDTVHGASFTEHSDIYSLTKSLLILFDKRDKAKPLLETILDCYRDYQIDQIIEKLEKLYREKKQKSIIDPQYWDEQTVKELNGRTYRIIRRLDSGIYFHVFQVMEIDSNQNDIAGPFVAKAIKGKDSICLEKVMASYRRIRQIAGDYFASRIIDMSDKWQENEICLIINWIEGIALKDLKGNLLSVTEGEEIEQSVINYMIKLCLGLTQLHKNGLVHGDVKPGNIIVRKKQIHLIDLGAVNENGSPPYFRSRQYCSREAEKNKIVFSDDIFSLAVSFFEVLFNKPPFEDLDHKEKGLSWDDTEKYPRLYKFMQKATDPDIMNRFESSMIALEFLSELTQDNELKNKAESESSESKTILGEKINNWLYSVLQSYPGSAIGNVETRGLDSDFAKETYIETNLDEFIYRDIIEKKVNLIILCGNAGDGKTALLQNLLTKLKIGNFDSKDRIIENKIGGSDLYVNLDGAASFGDRSSLELLGEFFQPFIEGDFDSSIIRIIAINDGPLLNWLEDHEQTWLSDQLIPRLFRQECNTLDKRIKFIDLNDRSLVGVSSGSYNMFLDKLITKILGKSNDWDNCSTCIAKDRCTAYFSYKRLTDIRTGPIIRKRILFALQAVHLKGKVHITAREIRAALIYIFFGAKFCRDVYTDNPEYYWDRAFNKETKSRQGDVLNELLYFDPALESHPKIDRYLLKNDASESINSLCSLRRMAYFEWDDDKINTIGDNQDSSYYPLSLSNTNYLKDFLDFEKGTDSRKQEICRQVCEGISKLESTISLEHERKDTIPLRITQYTPTETIFWVRKKLDNFSLYVPKAIQDYDIEYMHNHLILEYELKNNKKEFLLISSDLFELLRSIAKGYQLSDIGSDDSFANLSIFKQRLSQEDQQELFAYNPAQRDSIFRIFIDKNHNIQTLSIIEDR